MAGEYIANFRGKNDADYSRIAEDLQSNKVLQATDERGDEALAKNIAKIIFDLKAAITSHNTRTYTKKFFDKSERDGRFVAGVIAYRQRKPNRQVPSSSLPRRYWRRSAAIHDSRSGKIPLSYR